MQAQDALEDCQKMNPMSCDNIDLVNEISDELAEHMSKNSIAKELRTILRGSHFRVRFRHFYILTLCFEFS